MQDNRQRHGLTLVEVIGILLILFVLLLAMMPPVEQAREDARHVQCKNQLKQLMLALHNYHDVYGSLPPAYVADENGTPMHSWRVLIMPFIDNNNFTARYDFSEPWNGPNNSLLAEEFPNMPCYTCPSNPASNLSYMAVVGKGTIWPGSDCVRFRDVTDGTSNTIALVEVHSAKAHWMEPVDLELDKIPMAINPPHQLGISSQHSLDGVQVAFTDGTVRFLDVNTNPTQLKDWLLRNNGEAFCDNF